MTVRDKPALLALLADNLTRAISEEDLRDVVESTFGVYGVLYVHDAVTAQAGITTAPELFTGFVSNGLSSGLTVDHTTDSITAVTDGIYIVLFQNAFSATGNAIFDFHLRIDAVEKTSATHRKMSSGGDAGSVSFFDIVSLSTAEVVTIYVESDQGGGASITTVDAQLVLLKIA